MKTNKTPIIRKWFLRNTISIFCSILIVMGISYLVYASPGTTTIGKNISTTDLTASGSTILATTTLSGDLDLNLKQLKNVVLEKLSDFPSSPVEGQMFWSTAISTPYWYDAANTRWRTQKHSATIVVAAATSTNKWKADYICDGTNDEVQINAAIDALPSAGGRVLLLEGTFIINDTISLDSNNQYVTLEGQGDSTVINRFYAEACISREYRISSRRRLSGHSSFS